MHHRNLWFHKLPKILREEIFIIKKSTTNNKLHCNLFQTCMHYYNKKYKSFIKISSSSIKHTSVPKIIFLIKEFQCSHTMFIVHTSCFLIYNQRHVTHYIILVFPCIT